MTAPGAKRASLLCNDGCGKVKQHGKDGRCCTCWRVFHGLPPARQGRRSWGERARPVGDVPPEQACTTCLQRYAQEHGLCRQCSRAAGFFIPPAVKPEPEPLEVSEAKLATLRPVYVPRPELPTVVDEGVEFEVVRSLSVRVLLAGEFEAELEAARNPQGWASDGRPWTRARQRQIEK